jgi:hypothetical protein
MSKTVHSSVGVTTRRALTDCLIAIYLQAVQNPSAEFVAAEAQIKSSPIRLASD